MCHQLQAWHLEQKGLISRDDSLSVTSPSQHRNLGLPTRSPCKEVFVSMKVLVAQLCPTLCDPTDCSLPGSSVHGIFQARILECVAISFLQGIFPTQGVNWGLLKLKLQYFGHLMQRTDSLEKDPDAGKD